MHFPQKKQKTKNPNDQEKSEQRKSQETLNIIKILKKIRKDVAPLESDLSIGENKQLLWK